MGESLTILLNRRDSRIADLEENLKYWEHHALKGDGELNFLSDEIVALQQDIAGIKRKYPFPTFKLEGLCNKLKDTVTSKLDEAAAAQTSKDAEILALKEQLKQKDEMSGQLKAKDETIAALEAQLSKQMDENQRHSDEQDSEIVNLPANAEVQAELQTRLTASQSEVRKQAEETLQLQAEAQKIGTTGVEQSSGPRTSESHDKTKFACPAGLRTPSAGDVERRAEVEDLCQRLRMEVRYLHTEFFELKETYEHNIDTESFTTTDDWHDFEEQLEELQRKAEEALRVNNGTVYNEALGRAGVLVTDLHQMERKELSSRNDINKILTLIKQHEQKCKGTPVFGKHTVFPDFLPKKHATLRSGQ